MKTYTEAELKEVLEQHKLWVQDSSTGKLANLSGADLSGADLSGAYLSGANLSGADLSGAYLSGADLSGADLSGAYLSGADLSRADLSGADLSGAYLSGADLSGADLSGADLSGADLSGAYLSRANLSGADLSGADLSRANLYGADLSGADLSGAYLSRANLYGADLSGAYLSEKEWKDLRAKFTIVTQDTKYVYKKLNNKIIAHLEIPKKAQRSNAFTRKCRAEYVKVIKLIDENGKETKEGTAMYDSNFVYKKGKIIRPKSFNPNWYIECGEGIHFFLTEQEAKEFNI